MRTPTSRTNTLRATFRILLLFSCFLITSCTTTNAQIERKHTTWMHKGSAIKIFPLVIPNRYEFFYEASLSFQTSINPHWALELTLASGTPLSDIYYLPYFAVWPECRRYLCQTNRPNRKAHAFVPFFLGYRRNTDKDPYNTHPYTFHPWWIGAGTGIGGDIDIFRRFSLELMIGAATGREQVLHTYGNYGRIISSPQIRMQFVLPLR